MGTVMFQKTLFTKQVVVWIWHVGHSLPTPTLPLQFFLISQSVFMFVLLLFVFKKKDMEKKTGFFLVNSPFNH